MRTVLAHQRVELDERWRAVREVTGGHLVRVPVGAIILAGGVLAVAALTRPLAGALPRSTGVRWAWSADLIAHGQWWRLGSGLALTRDPFMLASTMASLMVGVGTLERLGGHTRAALTAVAGAVAGSAVVAGAVLGLRSAGLAAAGRWAATLDYGASAGVAACAGAVAGLLRYRPLTVALTVFMAGGLVLHHQIADWEHLAAFVVAGLACRNCSRDRRPRR